MFNWNRGGQSGFWGLQSICEMNCICYNVFFYLLLTQCVHLSFCTLTLIFSSTVTLGFKWSLSIGTTLTGCFNQLYSSVILLLKNTIFDILILLPYLHKRWRTNLWTCLLLRQEHNKLFKKFNTFISSSHKTCWNK